MEAAGGRRRRSSALSLAAVLVLAGLLFSTSANSARGGTQLRTDQANAVTLTKQEQARLDQRAAQVAALRREVEQRTAAVGTVNSEVATLRAQAAPLARTAGLDAVTGEAYVVELDDAPRTGGPLPDGVTPDDLVVHQQDVQAVVNALWKGGAEAMTLMDQRVIATSAVRCVGNTLILQGRVYSPPFRIMALGDRAKLEQALAESEAVTLYKQYHVQLKLGWKAGPVGVKTFPAFAGATDLRYARVVGAPSASPTAGRASAGASSSGSSSAGAATGSSSAGAGVTP